MQATRLGTGPIIDASTCRSIGQNIQGPSLVSVPAWVSNPLGRYHLYFADHKGGHIRLAFADAVEGPWTVHEPGSLQLKDSGFLIESPPSTPQELAALRKQYQAHFGSEYSVEEVMTDAITPHIASPDVHVDHEHQRFVMYFHGLESLGRQVTRVAFSEDGVRFHAQPQILGPSYFRVFRHDDWFYALVMPGQLRRSRDGVTDFEKGPVLFQPEMRHPAVRVNGDRLDVWWTRVGDSPESILYSSIDLRGDWMSWTQSPERLVLEPEQLWEGAGAAIEPSRRGAVHGLVNQLRDPCIFVEDDRTWLLYAAGGESGIGLAELTPS